MIEILGVGVPDGAGGWWLHRLCARLPAGQLVAVVSSRPGERQALLDSVSGRVIPLEGRSWVGGLPVMAASVGRLRTLVRDVRPLVHLPPVRTVLWNALAAAGIRRNALGGVLRFPRRSERQAAVEAVDALGLGAHLKEPVAALDTEARLRLAIATALAGRPEVLVIHDPDIHVGPADTAAILERLRALSAAQRVLVLVSLVSLGLACEYADRLLVISEGALIYDGPPTGMREARAARLGAFISAAR